MKLSQLDFFTGEAQNAEHRRNLNQQAAEIIATHRRSQQEKRKETVPPLPTLAQVARLQRVELGSPSATIPEKVIDVHRIDDAIVQAIEGHRCSLPTPRGPSRSFIVRQSVM